MKMKKRIAKLSGREVDQLVCEWCGNEEFHIDVNRDQITAHCTKCDYGIGFNRQSSKREGGGWGGVILETAKWEPTYITTNLPDHYKFHDDYFNEEVVVKSFPYMHIFGDFRVFNGLTLREFDDFLARLVPIFERRKKIAEESR